MVSFFDVQDMMPEKVISVFSGIGGLELGLRQREPDSILLVKLTVIGSSEK